MVVVVVFGSIVKARIIFTFMVSPLSADSTAYTSRENRGEYDNDIIIILQEYLSTNVKSWLIERHVIGHVRRGGAELR